MSGGLRLDKWLFQARFIHNRQLADELVAARRVRLNEQIVGQDAPTRAPGDVITLTEPARRCACCGSARSASGADPRSRRAGSTRRSRALD